MSDEPAHSDVVAAMQAAILVGNWPIAHELAANHLDITGVGWVYFCRWCGGRLLLLQYYRYNDVNDRTNNLHVPICAGCHSRRPWHRTT